MTGKPQGRKALDAVQMAVGRIFSGIKRKEPTLYQIWNEQVLAIGNKPVDRMSELMARDLNEGGIPITADQGNAIKQAPVEGDIVTEMTNTIARMATNQMRQIETLTNQWMSREEKLLNKISTLQYQINQVEKVEHSGKEDPKTMD